MNILVLGSGGREHALAWKIAQDAQVAQVFVAPGNAGTANESKCQNIQMDILDNAAIIDFAQKNDIAFIVVGPEAPLVNGVVDACQAAGLKIWGPTQAAAQLEGSKAFAKHFLKRHNIPTAFYDVFTDVASAKAYVTEHGAPIVIKADGLAAGKGVIVANDVPGFVANRVIVAMSNQEAFDAIDDMLSSNKFGDAGSRVVIEQFLDGEEASFICMVDGQNILPMATSQDHKRIFEADQGPNTGGMGAYSPAPVVTAEVFERVMKEVMRPTVDGMAQDGHTYTGFLYAGLMIDAEGQPRVIEFNCRFGDPEAQALLPLLDTDFLQLCLAISDRRLAKINLNWEAKASLAVVLAAKGYPGEYQKSIPIELKDIDSTVFYAGVTSEHGSLQSSGGRILSLVAKADNIQAAREKVYHDISKIATEGFVYRKDIACRKNRLENS